MHRRLFITAILFIGCLLSQGQTSYDTITISKEIEEVVIVQQRSSRFVETAGSQLVVNMAEIASMPKFLGTSDPIRYIQSLPGVQTNNETTAGIYVQGCDDYQTLTSINGAPIYYPNHLLGLYSTFIAPHFTTMTLEQAEHSGTMENRVGGLVNMTTHHRQPSRFQMEGNIGLVNSDMTLAIPCGKKSALWLSGRASYINMLYGKWLSMDGMDIRYGFGDGNITYAIHPNEKDEILFSGFYSRDKMGITVSEAAKVGVVWYNAMGQVAWNRQLADGDFRSTMSYSGFENNIVVKSPLADVQTLAGWASLDWKNRWTKQFSDHYLLQTAIDYAHYFYTPLGFEQSGITSMDSTFLYPMSHADEVSVGADWTHYVCHWFDYSIGIHGSFYHRDKCYGAVDPRLTFRFQPAENHEISLHAGTYTQYFHKAGLTGGGLPTDFFMAADSLFAPERAIATNLRYTASFLNGQLFLQAEAYFKQLYGIVESTGNILQLVNHGFQYEDCLIRGDGRNYGLNLLLQRTRGIVTGYVSYSLSWARRKLPTLDGIDEYIYAASHERRHDLNIVLNAQFAKRWNIGAQFVLASGLPYTKAEEAYMLNGQMICRYSTFNGAHMGLYNRLDLSCSCDIIKKKNHELGINISLYNVYCHKNQQFVVYRENLRPIQGTTLSTIIPSVSIYGKF